MGLNHARTQATSIFKASWPTQTTWDETALVSPPPFLMDHVAEYRPRSLQRPMSTIVGSGNHQNLVIPPAWLLAYYSDGQLSSIGEAISTITTLERHALVTAATSQMQELHAEDCGFRMLEPREIQAAMAFPSDYLVTGTRREQVKQLGNAVTPPVMHLLISRCLTSLA
ncbi:MAG TPA: DNA cytosine methyltransferase [Ktedonobacteraceae bacterium]|nr:DNA cytosine methyltransferase [Ktedonobacteraceae bacterium]